MHQVKEGDKFKLLGMEFRVEVVHEGLKRLYATSVRCFGESHNTLWLDLDKADLLEWIEPEENDKSTWAYLCTYPHDDKKLKREILEEIAEAWRDAEYGVDDMGRGFYYELHERAQIL